MKLLIKYMEYQFDWNGVTIVRSTEQGNCYYFLDKFGDKVIVNIKLYNNIHTALRDLKLKIIFYIKNGWVIPESY